MLRLTGELEQELEDCFAASVKSRPNTAVSQGITMVHLSDNTVKRFKYILAASRAPDHGIRVFVANGSCGPTLALGMAKEAMTGDTTIEKDGIKVFLEKDAHRMLSGTTLDFSETRGIHIKGMPRCCG